MNMQTFYSELRKFLDEVKRKPKSPYTDGYKDAIRYVLDWMEELL